jgi:hypothetical protein
MVCSETCQELVTKAAKMKTPIRTFPNIKRNPDNREIQSWLFIKKPYRR